MSETTETEAKEEVICQTDEEIRLLLAFREFRVVVHGAGATFRWWVRRRPIEPKEGARGE